MITYFEGALRQARLCIGLKDFPPDWFVFSSVEGRLSVVSPLCICVGCAQVITSAAAASLTRAAMYTDRSAVL